MPATFLTLTTKFAYLTVLHQMLEACANRRITTAVVDELITRGADINGRCANGQTALFYAREQGHEIIAQSLVARHFDENV